jgi:hypothetical protein
MPSKKLTQSNNKAQATSRSRDLPTRRPRQDKQAALAEEENPALAAERETGGHCRLFSIIPRAL